MRFADDLLLFATSSKAARSILDELMGEAGKCRLEVHESKTKLLCDGHGYDPGVKETTIRRQSFEVVSRGDATMYLGRLFSSKSTHDVELRKRAGKAWADFAFTVAS